MDDVELKAMGTVFEALEPLEAEAQQRVLSWVGGRLDLSDAAPTPQGSAGNGGRRFADVAELVDAAGPRSGTEYALTVAYWFQVVEGQSGFRGGELNDMLKNLGHGLSNVSVTLKSLIEKKPAYVMQIAKGRNRSGRKTYKLTAAGVTRVNEMIGGADDEE